MLIESNPNLPGVRILEVDKISPSVQSVSSSVAAFVGATSKGALNTPTRVESWLDFCEAFVTGTDFYPTQAAVQAFFENGGYKAYIVSAGTNPSVQDLKDAIDILEEEDEPAIVACPDMGAKVLPTDGADFKAIADHVITHCAKMGDRFGIIDMPDGGVDPTEGDSIVNLAGTLVGDRKHAAAYFPHLITMVDDEEKFVPPSGHVAGAMASTDVHRGVWKAPANVALRATGLRQKVTDSRQNGLNGAGVNVIRAFSGRGIRIWGARTLDTSSDTSWRYINVRRLFTMIEESVKKSTAWAVFEPNSPSTWRTIKVMLENYFTNLWKQGALLGSEPSHAFVVRVGLGETMTAAEVEAGQLIIEVGLAAVRPAEFIIFKIAHKGLEV